MSDEAENLVLQLLGRVDRKTDGIVADLQEIRSEIATLRIQFSGMDMSVALGGQRDLRMVDRLDELIRRVTALEARP